MTSLQGQLWQGWIPIEVAIADPEAYQQYVYLLKARRNVFLPFYTPEIVAYFRRWLKDPSIVDSQSWWYECNGTPLPWNKPIGVLYDILGDSKVPWKVTIRFHNYPKSILSLGSSTVLDYWTNQFKEAAYIRDGNANAIMNLSRESSRGLWRAVCEGDEDEFRRIAGPLLRSPKSIPLKIYRPGTTQATQKLVLPFEEDGEPRTVGMALNFVVGDLFPSSRSCLEARPLLHGAPIPLAAPILDVYNEAVYTDGFLHITIESLSI